MKTTFTNGIYRPFTANVPADLVGKEGFAVQLRTDGTIELFTTGVLIGVLDSRLERGSDWDVRIISTGSFRAIAGGVITPGSRVKVASGGKMVTIGTGGRSPGIYLGTANSADGDVIEVLEILESKATMPTITNTDGAIGGLSISNPPTQAEVTALRNACETLADDFRATAAATALIAA